MQPAPKVARPVDPLLQSITWLIYAPLKLLGGCLAGDVIIQLLQPLPSALSGPSWLNSPSHIVVSSTAGSVMAILLGLLWYRLLHRADCWFVISNMVVMSCSVYGMLMLVYQPVVVEAFPRNWIIPALAIGLGISLLQWYILRSRTHFAALWIPILIGSWFLVWFVVVGFGWLLND